MNYLKLTPLDSWFFRDGRPFHQGEPSADVESLFPPSAFTVVGAARAYLAQRMGWRNGKWDEKIIGILGDGYDLGPLMFRGPFIGRENSGEIEPLFPVPLNLLGRYEEGKGRLFKLLSPGKGIDCDLGKVRFPSAEGVEGMKTFMQHYLTKKSLTAVLQARTDDLEIVASRDLWDIEYAVGLARDRDTRTAKEGNLYSSCKIRLKRGVCLMIGIEGLGDDLPDQFALAMGGESKMSVAEKLDIREDPYSKPDLESENGHLRFTLTHLTPAWLERWPGPGEVLPGVPGKVVSACLDRPIRIGGWNSVKREPESLKPFIRPGSTWFCEADANKKEEVLQLHGSRIGEYTDFGFGEVVIGVW
ncbi:MAG: type III-B CRISPR module-associated protein Cmr3 [Methanothrix sp.]|nr:type III-B CRISPR module-associated protein Cmr3 [Methanothrix sp.]